MENPPFEDVFPIQDGDFPASYVRLPEGSLSLRKCFEDMFYQGIVGYTPTTEIPKLQHY